MIQYFSYWNIIIIVYFPENYRLMHMLHTRKSYVNIVYKCNRRDGCQRNRKFIIAEFNIIEKLLHLFIFLYFRSNIWPYFIFTAIIVVLYIVFLLSQYCVFFRSVRKQYSPSHIPSGIILCMRPANERRRYNGTSSLIDCAHAKNGPCIIRLRSCHLAQKTRNVNLIHWTHFKNHIAIYKQSS